MRDDGRIPIRVFDLRPPARPWYSKYEVAVNASNRTSRLAAKGSSFESAYRTTEAHNSVAGNLQEHKRPLLVRCNHVLPTIVVHVDDVNPAANA